MRRFLVVGCGGSGGAVLAYLMDQLRADLAAHGVPQLPRGWQFIHIDVPAVSEPGPGRLDSVEQQGGTYFSIGSPVDYRVVDNAVSRRLAERIGLDSLATWAPREPDRVRTAITAGAGQYRALGRMITASRAPQIRTTLQSACDRLNAAEALNEASRPLIPGLSSYISDTPIVLVVASMAGGTGAATALDVCRLIATVPGLDPRLVGIFLLAPNVFEALPAAARVGAAPNALALFGEIVAAQVGSATDADVALLETLGVSAHTDLKTPFARVFPVSRFLGAERAKLGDGSPNAVYRALGRGLAGLLTNERAIERFVAADLGDTADLHADRDLLGWGVDAESLAWGSFGFACLSMGRDRYAEYAAQRLARACVVRLLEGHLQPGDRASSREQVHHLLDALWPEIGRRIQIPLAEHEAYEWLRTGEAMSNDADAAAGAVVDTYLRLIITPMTIQATTFDATIREYEPAARTACRQSAERWADQWRVELLAKIEEEVRAVVARFGLPLAIAAVERLGLHLCEVVARQAERLADDHRRPDITATPAAVRPPPRLRGLRDVRTEALLEGYREQARAYFVAQAADLVRGVALDIVDGVLKPLVETLNGAVRVLEEGRNAEPVDIGLARVATDQPSAWPTDYHPRVPTRFDHAVNEVLLTGSADFPAQYERDVKAAIDVGPHAFEARYAEVVTQIVAGNWLTSGVLPPLNLLVREMDWRSRVFSTDPTSGHPVIPSAARYDAHVRPGDLLDRARQFVQRPGESFDRFCRVSLRDFVQGNGGPYAEQVLLTKFTEVLRLARPLVGIDPAALQAVHAGTQARYRYRFSEAPFASLSVAGQLLDLLSGDQGIDPQSLQSLRSALSEIDGVTRIDVFGGYPENYSPLVFDAILAPIAEQWDGTGDPGREVFWRWRRARPLAAALPMGLDERRAMVAGWFLGHIVGRIRIPEDTDRDPVQIFDEQTERWIAFPHPLLTPPSRFIATDDWLPAVLESVLLAIARMSQAPATASLAPYRALRSLYDDTSQSRATGLLQPSGRWLVEKWLSGRVTVPEGKSSVDGADAANGAERAELAAAWLRKIRDLVVDNYLAPDAGGSPDATFGVVRTRLQASRIPMFRDLAPDVHWAVDELNGLLTTAANSLPQTPAVEAPAPRTGVFISYRRSDQAALAGRLYDRLAATFGAEQIFIDVDSIEIGQDFVEVLEQRLARCRVVLIVIGRDWSDAMDEDGRRRLDEPGDFVRLEIEAGLRDPHVRVVPVLVDGAPMPRTSDLPPALHALARRNGLDIRNARFPADCATLVAALKHIFEAE